MLLVFKVFWPPVHVDFLKCIYFFDKKKSTFTTTHICTGLNCRLKPDNQISICNEFKQDMDNNWRWRVSCGWREGLEDWVWGWMGSLLPGGVNTAHCVLHFYCHFQTDSGKVRQINEIWMSINTGPGSIGSKWGWIFRSDTLNNSCLWQILKYLSCQA